MKLMRVFSAVGLTIFMAGLVPHLTSRAKAATELTLWEQEREEDQKILDGIAAQFEKANPDIKIKRAHYKTEDLRTQYQTAAMGGGGADLVYAPNDFAGPFSVMGIIQPVGTWGQMDRFSDAVVSTVKDAKGTVWGLPISNGNHLMLLVNKKLLAKAPDTVEEMIASAKKLSNPSKKQFGLAYNLNEPFWFITFFGAYGGHPLDGQKPNLNTPGMVSALDLVKTMKFKDQIVPPDCDYACADTLFSEGKVAMLINGDWSVKKYADTLKGDLIIAPLPKLASTGKYMAPMVSGKFMFFNKKLAGARLDAAKKYAEFFVTPAIQEVLVKEAKLLPAVKAMQTGTVMKADPMLNATLAAMSHGQPMPMAVELRAVWDAIRPQLQGVMAGRTDPKVAAQVMQKDAETKIKEMKE